MYNDSNFAGFHWKIRFTGRYLCVTAICPVKRNKVMHYIFISAMCNVYVIFTKKKVAGNLVANKSQQKKREEILPPVHWSGKMTQISWPHFCCGLFMLTTTTYFLVHLRNQKKRNIQPTSNEFWLFFMENSFYWTISLHDCELPC